MNHVSGNTLNQISDQVTVGRHFSPRQSDNFFCGPPPGRTGEDLGRLTISMAANHYGVHLKRRF